jgi:D-alanine transaminase
MDQVYLNGAFLPKDEARIPVDDRGFLFGDGVYEVTPFYGGVPFRLSRHLDRMRRGLAALQIGLEVERLEPLHGELLARNGLQRAEMAIVYLQVTRGAAPRTHHFPDPAPAPTVYAYARAFQRPTPEEWEKGYGAITVPDLRWARADLKTVQLLPNVLAQQAARAAGVADALLVRDGLALEGAHNNLFVVFGDRVATHPLSNQVLPGITREAVLDAARDRGVPVEERPIPLAELEDATELFFTGTTTEVRPTVQLDGRPVGDGRVGPVTRALQEGFLERVARECGVASPVGVGEG